MKQVMLLRTAAIMIVVCLAGAITIAIGSRRHTGSSSSAAPEKLPAPPAAVAAVTRKPWIDPCSSDRRDGNLYEPGPWISGRFTGANGRPYLLQLLQENWKNCGINATAAYISAIVYKDFGDRAQVASAERLFQIGRYGGAPTLEENQVRLTHLGNTRAGASYLAVGYSWWEGHGDDIDGRSVVILSVGLGPADVVQIAYHDDIETSLEGCTLEPVPDRPRNPARVNSRDCGDYRPFGYNGTLQFQESSTGPPDLIVHVAPNGTDRDDEAFKRIPAHDRVYRQDSRGLYRQVR